MTLRQILSGVKLRGELSPDLAEVNVGGLEYDSRRVGKDFLFFAFPGSKVDGRQFARDAVGRGALAVVSELPPPEDFAGRWIEVEHGRHALAVAARNFYQQPDERVLFTGITGTNGKTTTSYLIDAILREAGFVTGLIGTIEYRLAGERLPAANTTPESLDVLRFASGAGAARRTSRAYNGSFLARPRVGKSLRDSISHRCIHESDARSSGFSPHDGRVRRGEAALLFAPAIRRRRAGPC